MTSSVFVGSSQPRRCAKLDKGSRRVLMNIVFLILRTALSLRDSLYSSVELKIISSLEYSDLVENITTNLTFLAGCNPDQIYFIQMAVREIVTNAIQHGNRFDINKHVSIQYLFDRRSFEVQVRDQGAGFDYSHLPDPCDPANLMKSSGRGIFLVRSFMDDFSLRRIPEQGTEVRFMKRLQG